MLTERQHCKGFKYCYMMVSMYLQMARYGVRVTVAMDSSGMVPQDHSGLNLKECPISKTSFQYSVIVAPALL